MLHAEQRAHELRREIAVTEECLAQVQSLIGRNGMPAETRVIYDSLLAERLRLCGQLEVAEFAILAAGNRVSGHG